MATDNITTTEEVAVLNEDSFAVRKLMHLGSPMSTAPQVYVGTYHKYNCGSIFGEWIDLTTFSDYEEFMSFLAELHSDEEDPEYMMQDYENYPSAWYSESGMDEDTFNLIQQYADLNDNEREAFDAYIDCVGAKYASFEKFRDCWVGDWDSETDFAEHIVNEVYYDEVNGLLGQYFDYEAFGRDLFISDYYFEDGHVFNRAEM